VYLPAQKLREKICRRYIPRIIPVKRFNKRGETRAEGEKERRRRGEDRREGEKR
jgi:hypothetical protein